MPKFPATVTFYSLTKSDQGPVPKLTPLHVKEYAFIICFVLSSQEHKFGESCHLEGCNKVMNECICAASYNVDNGTFFLIGIASAEMKKVTYNLKLVIDVESVEVKKAHCECAQRCGPAAACKHILGMLLMLAHYVKTGELKIQMSCTGQLQSYKKPSRAHVRSPVRAGKLGKGALDFDPRPAKFRNMPGFTDAVYNAAINFCLLSGMDISLRYAFQGANVAGIIANHDYLAEPLNHV